MKIFVLVIFLFFSIASFGQLNDKCRAGSAYALVGKTYILSVFISEGYWGHDEKIEIYDEIYEAEKWLIKEANNYGKTISFEFGNFGLNETIIINDIVVGTGSGNESVDYVRVALEKVGYSSTLQFVDWTKNNTDCTNALVLIFANKPGRGYAIVYSKEMTKEKYFLEGCVLYNEHEKGLKINSGSIAHEILHLFGAWDLYETFAQTKEREDKASQLFPDDIMYRNSYNINELKIDRLTAWLTGLNSEEEDWYEWFRPSNKE